MHCDALLLNGFELSIKRDKTLPDPEQIDKPYLLGELIPVPDQVWLPRISGRNGRLVYFEIGEEIVAVIVAQVAFAVINGFIQGPTPVALAAQFPAEIRYSAIGIGYNVTLVIFGGTAPLVATWLIRETGDLAAPAWYIAAAAAVSCAATLSLKGRFDR
jgi:hypothetical protein